MKVNEVYLEKFTMDCPINFNGLLIKPVKMIDYFIFIRTIPILMINKNNLNDPKIISMSYLEYIIYLLENSDDDGKNVTSFMLYNLFKCTIECNSLDIQYGFNLNKPFIKINECVLNKKEFDTLKDIIIYYNFPDYDDIYINPELKEEMEEVDRLKNGNKKQVDLEKQMISVTIGTSYSFDDVKNMSIRKFHVLLGMINKKERYIIYKTASLSGFVEFKQEISHYLMEENEDISNKLMDADSFKSKINNANK